MEAGGGSEAQGRLGGAGSIGRAVGIAQDHGPRACLRDRFLMRRVYTVEVECALDAERIAWRWVALASNRTDFSENSLPLGSGQSAKLSVSS
jgi:hypothetical protein